MSLWKRLFGLDQAPGTEVPGEGDTQAEARARRGDEGEGSGPARVTDETSPASTPEQRLEAMGTGPDAVAADGEAEALRLFDEVSRAHRQARALDLARRVLEHRPNFRELRFQVARTLWARGDAGGAGRVLAPLVDAVEPSLAALMLAAEVAEGRGDTEQAMAAYQRVLARDLDYAQARERVARLKERREPRRELAGTTLMTDGALARGRYRVQRELGRGGAGTVFAARDDRIGRIIALKVYHRRGRLEIDRLLAEGRTPAHLEHPGIVRIFDLDTGLGAIAMEWVRGGSVRRELDAQAVPIERIRRWLVTALEAAAFVHGAGFVHRDLKPSNFLLRDDDRVVLTDFGLATRIGEELAVGGQGTLAYMAPEQRQAHALAAPAEDVHAFGATMRELLAKASGDVPEAWLSLAAACTRVDPASRPTLFQLRMDLT